MKMYSFFFSILFYCFFSFDFESRRSEICCFEEFSFRGSKVEEEDKIYIVKIIDDY